MQLAAAIDIGGTRTKIGIVAEDGSIVRRATINTSAAGEPAALSERAGGRKVRDVVAAAQHGEQLAADALAETGRWLGLGLASLSPIFAPDTIVVGGGIAAAGELLLEPVRASYRVHAAPEFRERVRIVGSSFGGW